MSRNYKFHNPEGLYFISFAVVGWLYLQEMSTKICFWKVWSIVKKIKD
jgi:hypothetical protein